MDQTATAATALNWSRALISELEANWKIIRSEYERIAELVQDWHEKELYGEGWKVFGLFDFPYGDPIHENIELCPTTASIVAKYNHGAAGFSVLRPHTRIQPHTGFQGPYLRCHLGLFCPVGDVALKVEDEKNITTYFWRDGKAFVFDDRKQHEAWNNTDQDRVVLIVDFIP